MIIKGATMKKKLKLFYENKKEDKKIKNKCSINFMLLFKKISIYKFLSISIIIGCFFYFSYFYFNNNSDFYIQISKGLVFPKNQFASLLLD